MAITLSIHPLRIEETDNAVPFHVVTCHGGVLAIADTREHAEIAMEALREMLRRLDLEARLQEVATRQASAREVRPR